MYKKTQLKNGLRVVTNEMKQRDSIALGFWIGVGGRFEDDPIKGAAHFLEHIVFKGSKKYSCEEIKELIEGVGGTLNAFTSEEQTCFYAKIPAKHIKQTFDVLSDMVVEPKIAQKDVVKESTVIVEEIKMYHDLPQYFVLELLDGLVWPGHPLGKSLAGSVETVSKMTSKDLRKFHKCHYNPENIVVAASGCLKHQEIVNLVKRKLGGLKKVKLADYERVQNIQDEPRVHFYKKNIEQMHLALGMPGLDEQHPDRYALNILNIILGGNMSSRLFVELREKRGLAYSISSCTKSLHDTGLFMIRAGVDNAKIVKAVKVTLKELKKIKRAGEIEPSEFKRAREYLLGQLLLGLEDSMEHMLWIGESVVAKDKIKTRQQVVKELEKVRLSDVRRVAKDILDERRFNLAVVGPITKKQEDDLKQLLKI